MKTYKEFIIEVSVGDWLLDTATKIVGGVALAGTAYVIYKGWSKHKQRKADKEIAKINKTADEEIKRIGNSGFPFGSNRIKDVEARRDKAIDDLMRDK